MGGMTKLPLRHRLFVDGPLEPGRAAKLSAAQAHYLGHVVRLAPGASVALFNGRDGEWRCEIVTLSRGGGEASVRERLRAQEAEPDLLLLFAPIKGPRIDTLAEKATELGVSAMRPVMTRRTVVSRVNIERLQANAVEAAEQSERLCVPTVLPPLDLPKALAALEPARRLIFCDERSVAPPVQDSLRHLEHGQPCAILTGPEGGFAPEEQAMIVRHPGAIAVTLGPRILRADTAAIAALAAWQMLVGDWARQ